MHSEVERVKGISPQEPGRSFDVNSYGNSTLGYWDAEDDRRGWQL